ncbi:hypothetical protein F5884DRAFT_798418 [Xylogone sp. PMI_703]|nr:hypothetical protein F5884DRAFT_798418 [Xylogone sp. PMI_703]
MISSPNFKDEGGPLLPELPPLTLGLLRVNRAIAAEAAAVFYRYNVFQFRAENRTDSIQDIWDPFYSFLLRIGPTNRGYLVHLRAAIYRSLGVSREAEGTITIPSTDRIWLRHVIAHEDYSHPYSFGDQNVPTEPLVDYVSPAIRAVFRILGPNGPDLRLSLIMPNGYLPGIALYEDDDTGWSSWWDEGIAIYIETMRKQYTSRSPGDKGRVEVLWEGSALKSVMDRSLPELEEIGWEVVKLRVMPRPNLQLESLFTVRRL